MSAVSGQTNVNDLPEAFSVKTVDYVLGIQSGVTSKFGYYVVYPYLSGQGGGGDASSVPPGWSEVDSSLYTATMIGPNRIGVSDTTGMEPGIPIRIGNGPTFGIITNVVPGLYIDYAGASIAAGSPLLTLATGSPARIVGVNDNGNMLAKRTKIIFKAAVPEVKGTISGAWMRASSWWSPRVVANPNNAVIYAPNVTVGATVRLLVNGNTMVTGSTGPDPTMYPPTFYAPTIQVPGSTTISMLQWQLVSWDPIYTYYGPNGEIVDWPGPPYSTDVASSIGNFTQGSPGSPEIAAYVLE